MSERDAAATTYADLGLAVKFAMFYGGRGTEEIGSRRFRVMRYGRAQWTTGWTHGERVGFSKNGQGSGFGLLEFFVASFAITRKHILDLGDSFVLASAFETKTCGARRLTVTLDLSVTAMYASHADAVALFGLADAARS